MQKQRVNHETHETHEKIENTRMSIWRWADWIEPVAPEARITLGEGGTPLVRSRRIGPQAGLKNLFFKLDMVSPTGSFKDRFAAAAISHMVANGQRVCVATSSGNTGAALAAYCAAAGIRCEIAIVETAPREKLKQMLAYGAKLYRIRGFGLDPDVTRRAFDWVQRMGSAPGATLHISAFRYSPAGMSGVQTISYELAEQSPEPIRHVFCPAGGGGLAVAVARGFAQLVDRKQLAASPAVECVQPEGNDTIAGPLRSGAAEGRTVQCTSAVSGLQVPTVIDGNETIRECRASGGTGHLVSDEEVWSAQAMLARDEGIFTEPAGATALAGALKARAQGYLQPEATVVCLVTGSGFKDQPSLDRILRDESCPIWELSDLEREL